MSVGWDGWIDIIVHRCSKSTVCDSKKKAGLLDQKNPVTKAILCGPFQLLEYQFSEGEFDTLKLINKPASTWPDASDKFMTEATSMGGGGGEGEICEGEPRAGKLNNNWLC